GPFPTPGCTPWVPSVIPPRPRTGPEKFAVGVRHFAPRRSNRYNPRPSPGNFLSGLAAIARSPALGTFAFGRFHTGLGLLLFELVNPGAGLVWPSLAPPSLPPPPGTLLKPLGAPAIAPGAGPNRRRLDRLDFGPAIDSALKRFVDCARSSNFATAPLVGPARPRFPPSISLAGRVLGPLVRPLTAL